MNGGSPDRERRTRGGGLWRLIGLLVLIAAAAGVAWLVLRPEAPPAPVAKQPGAIGEAIAVVPAASLASPPAAAHAATVRLPIFLNDRAETGPGGALRIRFTDTTMFSVGADASVTIDRYVFDPDRGASGMLVSFSRGAFRFVSGKPLHASDEPAIGTPVATIGVRGTIIDGVIGPEAETLWRAIDPGYVPDGGDLSTATLILLEEGAILVDGSGVRTMLDRPGQAIFFRRKGAAPLGPLTAGRDMLGRIGALGSPPGLGPEPGAPPPPSPSPSTTPEAAPTLVPVPSDVPSATPTAQPSPVPSPTATRRPPWVRETPTATPSPRPTYRPPVTRPTPVPTQSPTPRPTFRPPVTRFTPTPSPSPTLRPPVRLNPVRPSPSPSPTRPPRDQTKSPVIG